MEEKKVWSVRVALHKRALPKAGAPPRCITPKECDQAIGEVVGDGGERQLHA
jgi:hypothetical protein